MKTTSYLLIILAIGYSSILVGQISNNFESEFNLSIKIDTTHPSNTWQIGAPSKMTFSNAKSLPNAILTDTITTYPPSDTSSFIIKIGTTDLWGGFPYLMLTWDQKLDTELGKDGGLIELAYDSTSNWTNIFADSIYNPIQTSNFLLDTLFDGTQGITGVDTTWKNMGFCFTNLYFTSVDSIFLRFTFISDSIETNQAGWMMDNFESYLAIIDQTQNFVATELKRLQLYPNPTSSILNLELDEPSDLELTYQILNANGVATSISNTIKFNKTSIDISTLSEGLYYLVLRNEQGEIIGMDKWIKGE